jgi:hypothetical protein
LIVDSELDRLVRELIRTVPQPELLSNEPALPASFPPRLAGRHHTRPRFSDAERDAFSDRETHPAEMNFHPAINVIAERAQTLTRATGAAIALRKGMRLSVELEPAALHLTLASAYKLILVFPLNVFEPAR